jgi:hypothetical protein
MAKKRRKPHNHPRTRSAVDTAERPAPVAGNGRARSEDGARPGAAGSRSRAEKKELARRQREEVRKRVQRAERLRMMVWITGVTVVIAAAVFFFTRDDEPSTRPDVLPGELGSEAPWDANAELAGDRAELIGLPGHEGQLAMHEHVNLQIFVHGEPVEVPTNIGIDEASGDVQSLHTHEDSGTIHLESTVQYDFTLGDVFDIWGVRFEGNCLGGYCDEGDDTLRLFRNGQEITGRTFRDLPLDNQAVFVLAYGTEDELPDPIPSTFDFASVPQ